MYNFASYEIANFAREEKERRSFLCKIFLSIQLRLTATIAHNLVERSRFNEWVNYNYVDEHYKSVDKDRSWFHRNVAWLFIWDTSLVLLHSYPRRHAILLRISGSFTYPRCHAILLRFCASEYERFLQANGRSEHHSILHFDVFKTAESLAQSTVRVDYDRNRYLDCIIRNEGSRLQNIFRISWTPWKMIGTTRSRIRTSAWWQAKLI